MKKMLLGLMRVMVIVGLLGGGVAWGAEMAVNAIAQAEMPRALVDAEKDLELKRQEFEKEDGLRKLFREDENYDIRYINAKKEYLAAMETYNLELKKYNDKKSARAWRDYKKTIAQILKNTEPNNQALKDIIAIPVPESRKERLAYIKTVKMILEFGTPVDASDVETLKAHGDPLLMKAARSAYYKREFGDLEKLIAAAKPGSDDMRDLINKLETKIALSAEGRGGSLDLLSQKQLKNLRSMIVDDSGLKKVKTDNPLLEKAIEKKQQEREALVAEKKAKKDADRKRIDEEKNEVKKAAAKAKADEKETARKSKEETRKLGFLEIIRKITGDIDQQSRTLQSMQEENINGSNDKAIREYQKSIAGLKLEKRQLEEERDKGPRTVLQKIQDKAAVELAKREAERVMRVMQSDAFKTFQENQKDLDKARQEKAELEATFKKNQISDTPQSQSALKDAQEDVDFQEDSLKNNIKNVESEIEKPTFTDKALGKIAGKRAKGK